MTSRASPIESLLVFSDVHLGSDLNDGGPSVPRSTAIDRDLVSLLAHYREIDPPHADRWRLVVAGDFVDFVGMSIDLRDGDEVSTEPTPAERVFGLGGAEDHVRLKLKRAAARHPDVFAELAAFVAKGNVMTLISGNHDLEMHWDGVRDDFCALLAHGDLTKEDVAARVEFEPWFFHREGFVFIEHGHQYDPFCATPYVLAPLSPLDPRRVLQSLSDTLLRYIVRRTPGMKEYGHETRGLTSYISWGLMLGVRGTSGLFARFFRAMLTLGAIAKAYKSEIGAWLHEEHERRLARHAEMKRVSKELLRAALSLHVEPIGGTLRGVLASVMLDRLAVFVVMVSALVCTFVWRAHLGGYALPVTFALLALWAALHVWLSRGRPSVDPADVMSTRAGEVVKLFPASFVVMGHTHVPLTKPLGEAIYVNLGSWAEEELGPGENTASAYRAARTHLVVYERGNRHEAILYEWTAEGPRAVEVLVRPGAAQVEDDELTPAQEAVA